MPRIAQLPNLMASSEWPPVSGLFTFFLSTAFLVEMGGIEPPSDTHSLQFLESCRMRRTLAPEHILASSYERFLLHGTLYHELLAEEAGLEPATCGVKVRCSTS